MFPSNVPLTFSSVVVRRIIDTISGQVPSASFQSSLYPYPTVVSSAAMMVFSTILCCLYKRLRNGTLVRVGIGHKHTYYGGDPKHVIHRRRNDSWFLRNARACRSKCTDAVYRLARNSYDSLHMLNPQGILKNKFKMSPFHNHNNSIPFRQQIIGDTSPRIPPTEKCKVIYNNDKFNKEGSSSQDVNVTTRSRAASKMSQATAVEINKPNTRKSNLEKMSLRKRTSDRAKRNMQKNTRKTRSGKVYVYTL